MAQSQNKTDFIPNEISELFFDIHRKNLLHKCVILSITPLKKQKERTEFFLPFRKCLVRLLL